LEKEAACQLKAGIPVSKNSTIDMVLTVFFIFLAHYYQAAGR
jgi:hypothetical protein